MIPFLFYSFRQVILICGSMSGFFVFKKLFLFSLFQTGLIYKLSFLVNLSNGIYGVKKGTPKEYWLESVSKCIKNPRAIPRKPAKYPKIVYINLNILNANLRELSGIANAEMPVNATIIISIGLTIFAETAASPSISAPIIPTVVLKDDGTRILASCISSKEISIIIISNKIGKGIASRAATIAKSNSDGMISKWYVVIAIYIPGVSKAQNSAINLKKRKKFLGQIATKIYNSSNS